MSEPASHPSIFFDPGTKLLSSLIRTMAMWNEATSNMFLQVMIVRWNSMADIPTLNSHLLLK